MDFFETYATVGLCRILSSWGFGLHPSPQLCAVANSVVFPVFVTPLVRPSQLFYDTLVSTFVYSTNTSIVSDVDQLSNVFNWLDFFSVDFWAKVIYFSFRLQLDNFLQTCQLSRLFNVFYFRFFVHFDAVFVFCAITVSKLSPIKINTSHFEACLLTFLINYSDQRHSTYSVSSGIIYYRMLL